MKDQSKIIAAILVGAAAGAALGLLLAPNTGEGLRGDIADYVNDLVSSAKEKAQNTADNIKDYSNDVIGKAKSRFSSEVENADNFGNDIRDNATDHLNAAKSKVKDTADNINQTIQHA